MLKISLGKRCRKTGGAKTLKCDEKLVRLERNLWGLGETGKRKLQAELRGDDEGIVSVSGPVFSDSGE